MAELTWEGNSEAMFEKSVSSTPAPFRKMSKKSLMEAIEKNATGGVVTEDILIECVKEVTPKPFRGIALKTLNPLRSS